MAMGKHRRLGAAKDDVGEPASGSYRYRALGIKSFYQRPEPDDSTTPALTQSSIPTLRTVRTARLRTHLVHSPGASGRLLPPDQCWATVRAWNRIGQNRQEWRAADSRSIRHFLDFELHDAPPDHSTLSRTRRLIDVETHQAVFTWVLQNGWPTPSW